MKNILLLFIIFAFLIIPSTAFGQNSEDETTSEERIDQRNENEILIVETTEIQWSDFRMSQNDAQYVRGLFQ